MANRAKRQSELDGTGYLCSAFTDVERKFTLALESRSTITHDPTMGGATEDDWIDLLRRYLPRRYEVDSAFAVDRHGRTTDQLDCVIFDAHYTPALLGERRHRYVPAEAVYAVFEVKQTVNSGHIAAAMDKVESVRRLDRTSVKITHAGGEFAPKEPFHIIGGLLAKSAQWQDGLGRTFQDHFDQVEGDRRLDLVLTAESGFCDRFAEGEHIVCSAGDGALVNGLFRLLDALQRRGTVPAIDWMSYAAVFEASE